jgi:hypothetical protein
MTPAEIADIEKYDGARRAYQRIEILGLGSVSAYERLKVEMARHLGADDLGELAAAAGVPAESVRAFLSEIDPGACANHALTVRECERLAGVIRFPLP